MSCEEIFYTQQDKEFEFGHVYPLTGGISRISIIKLSSFSLNAAIELAVFTRLGNKFHSTGPRTANDASKEDKWDLYLGIEGT